MYADRRPQPSDPQFWQERLVAGRGFRRDRIKVLRLRRDPIWALMRRRLPSGAAVLDAGCGRGEWVAFLASRGYRSAGLDYSPALIERAREFCGGDADLRVGSILEMPYVDGSFDVVISWGVIEHDEAGPQRALREMLRVMRPGGMLFVTVPVDTPAMVRASVADAGPPQPDSFFQYHFRPRELAEAITSAGFDVVEVRPASRHYANVFPRVYAALNHRSPLARDLFGWLVRPYVSRHRQSVNMIIAVATKPRAITNGAQPPADG